MGLRAVVELVLICAVLFNLGETEAQSPYELQVNTGSVVTSIDDDKFLCVTLDWWPAAKCNYGQCPWGEAGLPYLDLKNPLLHETMKALHPLTVRAGGTLANLVVYDIGQLIPGEECKPFTMNGSALYNFTGGCLTMQRWDELNEFFIKAEVQVAFGINNLYGRSKEKADHNVTGPWDPRNTYDLIKYTRDKGYPVFAWECGNELLGYAIEKVINPYLYAEDVMKLDAIVDELYKDSPTKPLVIAPDSIYFINQTELPDFLQAAGAGRVDVVTNHYYNLGGGDLSPDQLIANILDPSYPNDLEKIYQALQDVMKKHPASETWVGEAGGIYNSGRHGVSDAFIMAFWYMDQLGTASYYNNKVFCRQSYIGGNYGLLDRTTFLPNPDYYGALLWRQLMGKGVLDVDVGGDSNIRAYAHCQRHHQSGVTLLVLNYSNSTSYDLTVKIPGSAEATRRPRLEYHMSAPNGNISGQVVALNDEPLLITPSGQVPTLSPVEKDPSTPVTLKPFNYAYVVFRDVHAPACATP
ncbi:hypothetical protein MPTK1_7g02860 [Marchantia polymorpha subsp. ruderalis]|uniref:Beta-glucuronidase C-terminal domain-containing protein n=2 Tax=Marchantia polymorpha TaxID=3197 RepID=A0A176VIG2_MARPO|nr:hypothetical protein AXG93_154s2040 [Marchantia polymorpha subsp. ruderalis]PTQ33451.1 hypothetical protein MARPO_0088s0001 [Marchantia polymorpha]BBN16019.1 hypothetical protein Mp_7g02860 [Marchantia polymorpha subsp. ruderalis]|eukprot:PTQ33451.1 hypothetical protein MARPO_0088s0001 [Marchantia polymorpha]